MRLHLRLPRTFETTYLLDNSEKLQYCMQVHVQNTALKGEPHNYEKMKHMVQSRVEQKIKDSLFKATNKLNETSVLGAPAKGKA